MQHYEIKKLLQTDSPVIFEVGAHEGNDSKHFLKQFKNVRLFCFEPDSRCIEAFEKKITDSRCVLTKKAVGSENGKVKFYPSTGNPEGNVEKTDWNYSSSIKKPENNPEALPWLHFKDAVEVDIITLDHFVSENNIDRIDFMWIDIQGAERDLIEGGEKALKITRFLKIEYGESETYKDAMDRQETAERLGKLNFAILNEYSSKNKSGDLVLKNMSL